MKKIMEMFANKAQTYTKQANIYYCEREYKKAIIYCDKAIQEDFERVEAHNIKGLCLDELGSHQEAMECYETVIRLKPFGSNAYYMKEKEASVNYNKGNSLRKVKKYEESLKYYDKALKFNNQDVDANYAKGNSLRDIKRYNEALEQYNIVLRLDNKDFEAQYNKALILEELKDYDAALRCYDDILKINPNHTGAQEQKNHLLKLSGKEVIKLTIDLEKKKPNEQKNKAAEYSSKANKLIDFKMYEEAIQWLDKSIESDPLQTTGYYNKGNALRELGRYKESLEYYDKAISINPNNSNYYCNKSASLQKLNEYKEALKCLMKAIHLEPNDWALYGNCGVLFIKLEEYDMAIAYFNKALTKNPECHKTHLDKARLLQMLGKPEESLESLDASIKLQPENSNGYYMKSIALFNLKKLEEAAECFYIAQDLEYRVLYDKAYSLRQQGDYDKAITQFDNLLDNNPDNIAQGGILLDKALCIVQRDHKIHTESLGGGVKNELNEDQVVDKVLKEMDATIAKLVDNDLVLEKDMGSSLEQAIPNRINTTKKLDKNNQEHVSNTSILFNGINSKAEDYFAKIKTQGTYRVKKANVCIIPKEEIKSFIFPKDYTNTKYTIQIKFENGKVKAFYGYKIGQKPVGGSHYWGVIDVEFKKDHVTKDKFVRVLKEAVYTGIEFDTNSGIKCMYGPQRKAVYEIKISQSDKRVYSNSVAESMLNKVIIFNHIGNHVDVKNYIKLAPIQIFTKIESISEIQDYVMTNDIHLAGENFTEN